jgi:hypothetical protein
MYPAVGARMLKLVPEGGHGLSEGGNAEAILERRQRLRIGWSQMGNVGLGEADSHDEVLVAVTLETWAKPFRTSLKGQEGRHSNELGSLCARKCAPCER